MIDTGATLVIGPAWVGDMVMAQSLFKTLNARNPGLAIDVVAPKWSLPLLERMPEVRAGIELAVGHGELKLGERLRLGKALRKRGYARAIVLPRSLKAALVPWAAAIPHRVGYRGEMRYGLINDLRRLDKTVLRQTVQRFVALGCGPDDPLPAPLPFPDLRVDATHQQRLMADLGLSVDQPIVALLPGAEYGPAKQWPLEHFGALACELARLGAQCWVFGSEKERALGEAIVTRAGGGARNLCGETQLVDVVDLLALARVAVSNDSGLMHAAAAVGLPLVAIYGSSSPDFTPPLSTRASIEYLALECSPCFDRTCHLGHTNCLNRIAPERIVTLARQHLD